MKGAGRDRRIWIPLALLVAALASAVAQDAVLEEHLRKAYDLAQKGDLGAAETVMREGVKLTPDDASGLAYLGVVLTREEKLDEACVYLERALIIDASLTGTRFNLALNQFRLRKLEPAAANLERVLEQNPDHAPARILLGTILAARNDCDRAIKLLESAGDLAGRPPDAITALARCYYSAGRREQARRMLDRLAGHPAGADAVFDGAMIALGARDFEAAEGLLATIRSRYRDPERLAYTLALVQYNQGKYKECQSTLEEWTTRGARRADLWDLLAWCLEREQRKTEALRAMKEAIGLEPESGPRFAHLAQMLLDQGSFPDAYDAARSSVAKGGGGPAYRIQGEAETALGMLKQADASYLRAVELDPRDAEALLMLGVSQHSLWKYKEAEASFDKGIRLFPGDTRFYLAYGRMLLDPRANADAADQTRAVRLLEQALKYDASLAEAHYEIGLYLLRTGRAQDAVPRLESAVRLSPRNRLAHLALANAYRLTWRAEEAARERTQADSLR